MAPGPRRPLQRGVMSGPGGREVFGVSYREEGESGMHYMAAHTLQALVSKRVAAHPLVAAPQTTERGVHVNYSL